MIWAVLFLFSFNNSFFCPMTIYVLKKTKCMTGLGSVECKTHKMIFIIFTLIESFSAPFGNINVTFSCLLFFAISLWAVFTCGMFREFKSLVVRLWVCVPLSDCGACCTGSHCLAGGTARRPNIGCTCCWSRLKEREQIKRNTCTVFKSVTPLLSVWMRLSLTHTQLHKNMITTETKLTYNTEIKKLLEFLNSQLTVKAELYSVCQTVKAFIEYSLLFTFSVN